MWGTITDPGVASAIRTLAATNSSLASAISQAATGKTVATAADDPAAYVIAIRLKSDAQALMAVRTGLAGAQVPTRVAGAAINGITDVLMKLKEATFEAQAGGVSASAAGTQIQALLSQVTSYQSDANVNGVNLVAGAVGGGVNLTRLQVPRNLEGNTITIGDMGLSQMNASVPGLGLDNFSATSDGINLNLSSLSVQNISTASPPVQVEVQTANYDNTNPNNGSVESPQYPGQRWTFVFTDASASNTSTDSNVQPDLAGNITHEDHTIPVPLSVGFSLSDAVTALQTAMYAAKFETRFTASSLGTTLSIAGNNVGLVASVQNLRSSFPMTIGTGSANVAAAVIVPPATSQISVGSLSLPTGAPPSSLVGAIWLSDRAEYDAYTSSNPTKPAFYVEPLGSSTAIATGTTIDSVASIIPATTPPTYDITLSSGVLADIPNGSAIRLLVPLPVIPFMDSSPWVGAEGAIATLNSALRKTGDMAQTLGNAVNSLQQAQDRATQSADDLNLSIGNTTAADMGKVSANLQSLQIRQQLATQTLVLGEQWSGLILQLFK